MTEEETSKLTCASDPVHAPAHYAGDGKIECKAAMGSMMAGLRPRGGLLKRGVLVRLRFQVLVAMAAEEQPRRPQESARMHRYRAFARRGVKEKTECQSTR